MVSSFGLLSCAPSRGQEIENSGILGWGARDAGMVRHHFRRLPGAIAAAEGGQLAAGDHSVGVELIAQEAEAWARMGRRREREAALERGRIALESMPYPDNTDNPSVERSERTTGFSRWGNRVKFQL
jgi:hypothetical protein